jgi:hypothetical protein
MISMSKKIYDTDLSRVAEDDSLHLYFNQCRKYALDVRVCHTHTFLSKPPNILKGCNWRVAKLDPVETL